MPRETMKDFTDLEMSEPEIRGVPPGAEARMSRRRFLKLGALSFAAAACARLPEAFTPTPPAEIKPTRPATQVPAETKIAPTQAEAGSFNSASVLSGTDILNDEQIGSQVKILRDSLVANLQSKPENSAYDTYTLWGISPETSEKSLFLFITARDTKENQAAVFMVLPDGTGLAWARLLKPLETTNSKGDRVLELLLTKDRVTGEELKDPLVIFTFSLSSEADTIFTPFGDSPEFQNQTAPIPKIILANYIEATATPEAPKPTQTEILALPEGIGKPMSQEEMRAIFDSARRLKSSGGSLIPLVMYDWDTYVEGEDNFPSGYAIVARSPKPNALGYYFGDIIMPFGGRENGKLGLVTVMWSVDLNESLFVGNIYDRYRVPMSGWVQGGYTFEDFLPHLKRGDGVNFLIMAAMSQETRDLAYADNPVQQWKVKSVQVIDLIGDDTREVGRIISGDGKGYDGKALGPIGVVGLIVVGK